MYDVKVVFLVGGVASKNASLERLPAIGDHVELGSSNPNEPMLVLVKSRVWKQRNTDFQQVDLICEIVKTSKKEKMK